MSRCWPTRNGCWKSRTRTLVTRSNLARSYAAAGEVGRAVLLCEQVLADSERLLGAEHPSTLIARNNLAGAYQQAGETRRAIPLVERAVADSERLLGADHPDTLSFGNNLAGAYAEAGHVRRAIPLYDQVLADRQRILGADHPRTLISASNLAADLERLGDHDAAAALQAEVKQRRTGRCGNTGRARPDAVRPAVSGTDRLAVTPCAAAAAVNSGQRCSVYVESTR